jgi:hypothetical protein
MNLVGHGLADKPAAVKSWHEARRILGALDEVTSQKLAACCVCTDPLPDRLFNYADQLYEGLQA